MKSMVHPLISKEQFTQEYAERSGVTVSMLLDRSVVVRCRCDDPMCEGWAMVPKSCAEDYAPGGIYNRAGLSDDE